MKSVPQSFRFSWIHLWIFPFLLLLPAPASSQQFAANEFTVGATLQTFGWIDCEAIGNGPACNPVTVHSVYVPIPSFTYTRNLSRSVALEGTIQPTSDFVRTDGFDSGHEALALGGIKSGWRGQRWGLYGKFQAGVASFSCAVSSYSGKTTSGYTEYCSRLTDFAMEYGGVVEYHKTPRYAFRLDAGHLEIAEFDQIFSRYTDGAVMQYRAGGILQHADLRIGVTRSFGHLETATPDRAPARQNWDAGVTFALQPRIQPDFQFLSAYPEWGLWASWNFSKHVSWDSAVMHSGRNPGFTEWIDEQSGGRAFEALSGVKFGFRSGHFGYFVKARPGIITFGETERQIDLVRYGFGHARDRYSKIKADVGMFTNLALDTGGVIEAYPTRHTILRFEAGNATIFYLPKTVIDLGQRVPIPEQTKPTMLVGFGAGFRF